MWTLAPSRPAAAKLITHHSSLITDLMAQSKEFRGNSHRRMLEMNEWTKKRQEPALEPDLPIIDPHHHLWDSEERGGRYLMHELAEDTATGGHNILATV